MRIAYVSSFFLPHVGGMETSIARVASQLAAWGHRVEVLTQGDSNLPSLEVVDGVTVRRFPIIVPSEAYAFAPSLWRYLMRHRESYDIVHAHNYQALPALGAALTKHAPLIFTPHYHGTSPSRLGRMLHRPYRLAGAFVFTRADHILCVSEAEAHIVRRDFPSVSDRITVVYLGVDTDALRAARPYSHDHTIILSTGRLVAHKNVDRVIEAMAHLDRSFVLRIIGDGPARPMLEALAGRLGLAERVQFLGRVDDAVLHRWYRTASIYVSLSRMEAFGLTLREAIYAGSRVVAADIPAYHEAVPTDTDDTIRFVPLDITPADLANAIRALAMRGASNANMDVISWETTTNQTLQIYKQVLLDRNVLDPDGADVTSTS